MGLLSKYRANREQQAEFAAREQELQVFVTRLVGSDEVLSDTQERELLAYLDAHQIPPDSLVQFPEVCKLILLGRANAGRPQDVPTTVILKKGERAFVDIQAELLKEVTTTKREWRGASRGVSIPIGLGMRYRVGQTRGHMVTVGTETSMQTVDVGELVVTSGRVVFHGNRKTLEFGFPKLVTLNVYADGVGLGVTNRQTVSIFRGFDGPWMAGMIKASLAQFSP